jgi:hypothetical protein
MKLILFGGAETELGQVVPEIQMIGEVINRLKPKQVLHIPFARIVASEPEWAGDWFNQNIKLDDTVYLNAANEADLAQADHPLIFISGGNDHVNLYDKITSNPRLLDLIMEADFYIGESAGSAVLGEYRFLDGKLVKRLGLIKDTVIVPHYTQRHRQQVLTDLMQQSGVKYGLGIDSMTAIEFELNEFPEKFSKIGEGNIEIKHG